MKSHLMTPILAIAFMALTLTGCAQQPKAASSSAAIEQSKSLASVEEQVKYLVAQANTFINSQQFDQAINTAQYILGNLDQNSIDAKSILEKAQAELKKFAESKAAELKKKLGGLGQ